MPSDRYGSAVLTLQGGGAIARSACMAATPLLKCHRAVRSGPCDSHEGQAPWGAGREAAVGPDTLFGVRHGGGGSEW